MTARARKRPPHRIGLVLTGGTVGSGVHAPDDDTKLVRLLDGMVDAEAPELELIWKASPQASGLEISVRRPVGLLSENLIPEDWLPMAASIRSLVAEDGVEGVLVLHGTDTMTYTSAALSFMLADLPVPVVLTGSNKPPDQERSDALQNVRAALTALRHLELGVFVVFAGRPTAPGRVYAGTRVRKVRASGAAFSSIGRRPVGEVRDGGLKRFWTPTPPRAVSTHDGIDDRVLSLRLYPGLDLTAMLGPMEAGAMRGVVLELYPSFTAPTGVRRFSAPAFVAACTARDTAVIATVANEPTGKPNVYESQLELESAGAEVLHMTPETATVKLMWALAAHPDRDSVLELMRTEIAGEMAP